MLGPEPVAYAVTHGSRWWVDHWRARRAMIALLRTSTLPAAREDEAVELGHVPGAQGVPQAPVDDREQLGLRTDRPRGADPQAVVGRVQLRDQDGHLLLGAERIGEQQRDEHDLLDAAGR